MPRPARGGGDATSAISGSATVNVEPRPGPSLSARTVPPCSSTRCRTMARPRPRPPCCARGGRIGLAEPLEHVGQELGRDAGPVVAHDELDAAVAADRRAPSPCRRRGVNLIALDRRFQTTCCSRSGSPETDAGPASRTSFSADPLRGRGVAHRFAAALTTVARSRALDVQAQLAGDDAGDVEHVLDELGLGAGVPVDDHDRARRPHRSQVARIRRVVQPTMAFSGVRSSWESVARNWSFSRFASSASPEKLGPLLDAMLELRLDAAQLRVAPLEPVEHLVERGDEHADLVPPAWHRAHREVAALGDGPRRSREIQDRGGDGAPGAAAGEERSQEGGEGNRGRRWPGSGAATPSARRGRPG